jgi:peptidoglycan/xylan/chitin deacetylase (PgdA/CDA1 family)
MLLIPQHPNTKSIFLFLIGIWLTVFELLPDVAMARYYYRHDSQVTPSSLPQPGETVCSNNGGLNTEISSGLGMLSQISTWVTQPDQGLQTLIEKLGPYVFAFVNRSPWPYINDKAKLDKVPILMYHDILPKKQVFFDVTPDELAADFQLIKDQGVTPISLDQLMIHLQTGLPLPEKPVVLTFDDGYEGHYKYVYPLLKKYGYPAVFSVYTDGIGKNAMYTTSGDGQTKLVGRDHLSWEQVKEMAADPLVTISSHSITHPPDLTKLTDEQIRREIVESKQILETNLQIPIRYFTYPAGKYNEFVQRWVYTAGYQLALTMSDTDERFAGASDNLLAVSRFGQSKIQEALDQAWGGGNLASWHLGFDFNSVVQKTDTTIDKIPLILISGGKPITIHADSRYQVSEILARSGTQAIAAVDGTFFSLKLLTSNVMIGPVLSQVTHKFIPGNSWDNTKIAGRPLVLISPQEIRFIPYDPTKHNTLAGIQAEMPDVTDAFVAGAWLVQNGQPQPASTFNGLYGYDIARYRAFWGINQDGQPTIGISRQSVDSVSLGVALAKAGLRDAVMVDSGQSTSLTYQGQSLVNYTPRPVPHAIALVPPPTQPNSACVVAEDKIKNRGSQNTRLNQNLEVRIPN